jgi:hypothetical protein
MGYARIRISGALFREWLPLPHGTEILGSRERHGEVEIVVSHQDLPQPVDGEGPVLAMPHFRKNQPVEFIDWGLL